MQQGCFASIFMRWHAVQIIKVVRHVLLEKGWWQLPRYAFGTSSGGCIALELALRFPLQVQFTATKAQLGMCVLASYRISSSWMKGCCPDSSFSHRQRANIVAAGEHAEMHLAAEKKRSFASQICSNRVLFWAQ